MQLNLPRAITFRRPEELLSALQPEGHRLVIEIQPGRVGFAEQLTSRTRFRIDPENKLFLFHAVLDHQAKRRSLLFPNDARQVWIFFPIPLHPPRFWRNVLLSARG